MEIVTDLNSWFNDRLLGVKCSDDARAYIVSVLVERSTSPSPISGRSIVLSYAEARASCKFEPHRDVGDCVLWSLSTGAECYNSHRSVAETLAKLSYYSCYRMLQRRWALYEELADDLEKISYDVCCKLAQSRGITETEVWRRSDQTLLK